MTERQASEQLDSLVPYLTPQHRPQRLTPDFLESVSFPAARIGKRGLDESHVRVFCEWVESELVRLLNERVALEQELIRLRDRSRVRDDGTDNPDDARTEALSIMLRAKQIADTYIANAQEYSRDVAQDARRRREEILAEAKMQASVILDEAQAPAGAGQAAQLTIAPAVEQSGTHEDLAAELANLRTLGKVCRTHLRTQLESLSHGIDEWEHAEKYTDELH